MLTGARKRPYDSFIARHHRPDTFLRVVECYHRVALGASVEHEMGDILWEDLNPHASERFSHENTRHERRVVGQGEVEAFGSVSDLTLRAPERVVGAPLAQGIGDSTGADDLHFTAGVRLGKGGLRSTDVIEHCPSPRR